MSTLAIDNRSLARRRYDVTRSLPVRRPTEATFRRRRLVVGTVCAVLVVFAGLVVNEVLAGDGGATASAAVAGPTPQRLTVTAQPGDTLWSIARKFHGSVDVNRFLDRLITLNGGASIQIGQAVVLP